MLFGPYSTPTGRTRMHKSGRFKAAEAMMTSSERFQIASQEFARFHEHVSHQIKSDIGHARIRFPVEDSRSTS